MFLGKDFLLTNDVAKTLYHDYAEKMPIIDYHCHLEPSEIYEDKQFENITQIWLGGDHYKWRLMRANGVPEEKVTGNASDYDKFLAWAETIEQCIGNPLYVWTHLELKRIFGIDELLTLENAPTIWEKANAKLADKSMSAREIIKNMDVKVICTTDDPNSDLHYHQKLAEEETSFKVFPTFRPDKAITIDGPDFVANLKEMENLTGKTITSYQGMLAALRDRMTFFHENGCRLSDHSFTEIAYYDITNEQIAEIFEKALKQETLTKEEVGGYQYTLLCDLMRLYHEQGWTCQLHLMATRNNDSRLFNTVGADAGGDAMNDARIVEVVGKVFNTVNQENKLPKTILYSLNPKDFVPLTALMGCFQSETKGKIQLGSAWWFNDTYYGMRQQMIALAEGGILGNFVGMLTDSRSFLSYPRHEYFRRILCQLISEWVEDGQLPDDTEMLGEIVKKVSYANADTYFDFV